MTTRGRLALALGAALYLAAWAFGSRPLYPVAVGLLLLNPIAWACVRLADRPLQLHRRTRRPDHLEGEDVDVDVVLECGQGESLRRVHWPTTARRGQLMVKELEDSPRDEVAVVLDAEAGTAAGEPADRSFDLQVRAAGSILRAHVRRGRRAVLVVNDRSLESLRVTSLDGDWRRALELLAAAEPNGNRAVAALLASETGPAARARELALVTSCLTAQLVDRLVQRGLVHAGVSLVFVDAASFAGRPPSPSTTALLLRLQGAGIPACVLRRGDDLGERLGGALAARPTAAGGRP
jgi:Protein of unknown function DUF58